MTLLSVCVLEVGSNYNTVTSVTYLTDCFYIHQYPFSGSFKCNYFMSVLGFKRILAGHVEISSWVCMCHLPNLTSVFLFVLGKAQSTVEGLCACSSRGPSKVIRPLWSLHGCLQCFHHALLQLVRVCVCSVLQCHYQVLH